ncbi:adenylyltransferase/cytidyltransferase family protein [Candidatus Woesearchaeota archaeon]|jgi:D-beta-D-heptose 7-phosphate kinase/D-beta-D-heptose 1-phosphate adenosyltransferase|nr:adenylyltransferase/cytidyltransferase family protein [Candidatus Woesearchaeota archaeon]
MARIVLTSGYFNPLHVGHLECLEKAKQLGDKLIVIVNNDEQVKLKGSVPFMNQEDRLKIISSLKYVDNVFLSIDKDKSVCRSIEELVKKNGGNEFIFAKGGDRIIGNIPEKEICERLNVKIIDGLGEKIRASSDLINNYYKSMNN